MSTALVKSGQNVYDVCLQEFGDLESFFIFILDNGLNINSKLSAGQELTVNNEGVGDDTVKSFVKLKGIRFANDQSNGLPPIEAGDFGNDYDNNYG